MNIGDLFLQLLADGSKLTQSVTKEAEKAGDAGAQTLGQRMSSGLKTAGVKAFGVAAAGAFAIATKGALELENAQAEIQAQTGLNAEQAKEVALAANRIAGENRLSLQAVQDIAIAVHNDLGLVGEEADKATAKIAQFARVTHQDGAAAVAALDDVTDAWNLTSEETLSLTDQLLVSQQKFGGSIAENTDALARLAPQMQALGATTDDTIGLLNLFSASGIDSSKAVAALNTAVKNLKPGENLDDLVARLSAIEDPTLRAQEAIKVFGSRGGVALANALKPGVDSLDDFAITAEEAAGAVSDSAEALDNTFSGRIQKAISVATANLREFGAAFGPVLTSAAALASLFATTGLGRGLGRGLAGAATKGVEGLKGNSKFSAASTSLGKFMGTRLGKGISVGLAAVGIVEVVQKWMEIQGQLDEQSAAIGETIAEQITTDTVEGLQSKREVLLAGIQQLADASWYNPFADFQRDELDKQLAQVNAEIEAAAQRWGHTAMSGLATGLHENQSVYTTALDGTIIDPAKKTGERWTEAIGQGIIDHRNAVGDAFNNVLDFAQNILRRGERIAKDIGILTDERLIEGLKDKNPAVRAAFEQVQMDAITELQKIVAKGGTIGKKGGEALEKALKSKNPQVREAAKLLKNTLDAQLDKAVPAAKETGEDAGAAFARGALQAAAAALRAGQAAFLIGGPSGYSKAGQQAGKGDGGHATGGRERAGMPRWVGERGAEVFVPNAGGYTVSRTDAIRALAGSGGGSGDTIINMPVSGALPVSTISDISGEMQRIDDTGLLPTKRIAPLYNRRLAAGAGARR